MLFLNCPSPDPDGEGNAIIILAAFVEYLWHTVTLKKGIRDGAAHAILNEQVDCAAFMVK